MKAVDSNILVYARRVEPREHPKAVSVLRDLVMGLEPWVLPWPCVYEFLQVVTHPRLFKPPTPIHEAWESIERLFDSPSSVMVSEGPRHKEILSRLVKSHSLSGNLLHDAHIAALLLEHGVSEILTADEDFHRFRGLKVTNPFLHNP